MYKLKKLFYNFSVIILYSVSKKFFNFFTYLSFSRNRMILKYKDKIIFRMKN